MGSDPSACLIPALGLLWGVLFLDELVTPAMVVGCAVILAGTALATGVPGQDRLRRIGARWLTLLRSA
jgi:drug/metabolite transporter (DMT)-like permease